MVAVARSLSCHEVAFGEGASVRHSLPLYLRLQQQQQGLVLGQLVVRESVIHFFELRESTNRNRNSSDSRLGRMERLLQKMPDTNLPFAPQMRER